MLYKIIVIILILSIFASSYFIRNVNTVMYPNLLERKNIRIISYAYLSMCIFQIFTIFGMDICNYLTISYHQNWYPNWFSKVADFHNMYLHYVLEYILYSIVIFNYKYIIKLYRYIGIEWKQLIIDTFIVVAISCFFAYLIYFIIINFSNVPHNSIISSNQRSVNHMFNSSNRYLYTYFKFLFIPFLEEVVYRCFLWEKIEKKWNTKSAFIWTALFFSLMHMINDIFPFNFSVLMNFIYYLSISLSLSYIRKNRGLESSIIIHTLYNILITFIKSI